LYFVTEVVGVFVRFRAASKRHEALNIKHFCGFSRLRVVCQKNLSR
jgi:hypothetical protein